MFLTNIFVINAKLKSSFMGYLGIHIKSMNCEECRYIFNFGGNLKSHVRKNGEHAFNASIEFLKLPSEDSNKR